jgi:hypothetical protein
MPADQGSPAPRTRRESGHIRLAQSQALVHGQPCAGGQQTQDLGSHGRAPSQTLSQRHPPVLPFTAAPADRSRQEINNPRYPTALITGRSGAKGRLGTGLS